MSILGALKQQTESIDDLAKLPQAMIMQMAQRGQIREDMLAPILGRKAEMADAVARMQALKTAGQTPPTVMEQLMSANAMAEAPEVGVGQLPIPERQYAGGGIIVFSKGSLIDDDYDEYDIDPYRDYAKAFAAMQQVVPVRQPSRLEAGLSKVLPQSYEAALAEKGETPATIRKAAIEEPKKQVAQERVRGGHKYEDMVVKEAERLNLDPKLALHVLYKETGNLKNPETAKSPAGAIGVMQLMPKTAKSLGVDPLNPEENIRGGVTYLKQMYDKYQDPTLALAAYNAGPGRLDKALKSGQGIAALPRETQNYIRMAQGGEVQRFEDGGQPRVGRASQAVGSSFFPESQRTAAAKKKRPLEPTESELKNLGIQHQRQGEQDAAAALPVEFNTAPIAMDRPTYEELGYTPTANILRPEEDRFATFIKGIESDRAALAKQRAEDKNMALLAAGLGMLGGESPYAFTNIGKGGMSGVSYLSEANKQRAAEKAALDRAQVAAMHYQSAADIAKDTRLTKEERQLLEAQKLQETSFQNAIRYRDMMLNRLKSEGFDPALMSLLPNNDPQKQAFNKRLYDIENDPYLLQQYRKAGFPSKEQTTGSAPISTQGYRIVK